MIATVRTPADVEHGLTQAIHLSQFLQDHQDAGRADGPDASILEGISSILMAVYAVWDDIYSHCEGQGLHEALHDSSVVLVTTASQIATMSQMTALTRGGHDGG